MEVQPMMLRSICVAAAVVFASSHARAVEKTMSINFVGDWCFASQEDKTTSYTLPSWTEDGHCTKILSIEQYSFFGDPHDAVADSELFLKFLRYMMTSIPIGIQMKLR